MSKKFKKELNSNVDKFMIELDAKLSRTYGSMFLLTDDIEAAKVSLASALKRSIRTQLWLAKDE